MASEPNIFRPKDVSKQKFANGAGAGGIAMGSVSCVYVMLSRRMILGRMPQHGTHFVLVEFSRSCALLLYAELMRTSRKTRIPSVVPASPPAQCSASENAKLFALC